MRLNRLTAAWRVLAASALTLAAAAGVVVAGAPAANASFDCIWKPLTLLNGWQSADSQWSTGYPSYCVSIYGMVYLSGSLTQPSAGGDEVAVLPPEARPASNSYLSVYTYGGTTGTLLIGSDGQIFALGSSAPKFTSLAAISFTAPGVAQQPLTLTNGWQSANSEWNTGDPSYWVLGGIVHLSGSLTVPNFTSWQAAYLPPGVQPSGCFVTDMYTFGGTVGTMEVENVGGSGDLLMGADGGNEGSGEQFSSLAGLSYPAAPAAWQPLTMYDGWQTETGCDNASYEIAGGGVVYLTGVVWPGNVGAAFSVLPTAARPVHNLYITLHGEAGQIASLLIEPDGSMIIFGEPNPQYGVDLGGLSYHVQS